MHGNKEDLRSHLWVCKKSDWQPVLKSIHALFRLTARFDEKSCIFSLDNQFWRKFMHFFAWQSILKKIHAFFSLAGQCWRKVYHFFAWQPALAKNTVFFRLTATFGSIFRLTAKDSSFSPDFLAITCPSASKFESNEWGRHLLWFVSFGVIFYEYEKSRIFDLSSMYFSVGVNNQHKQNKNTKNQ